MAQTAFFEAILKLFVLKNMILQHGMSKFSKRYIKKIRSLESFKAIVPYFESNLLPQKCGGYFA